jgi:hypothetical protein
VVLWSAFLPGALVVGVWAIALTGAVGEIVGKGGWVVLEWFLLLSFLVKVLLLRGCLGKLIALLVVLVLVFGLLYWLKVVLV